MNGKTIPKSATGRTSPKFENKLEQLLNCPQNQEQQSGQGQRQTGTTNNSLHQQSNRKNLKKLLAMANIRMQTTAYKSASNYSQQRRNYTPSNSSDVTGISAKSTTNPIYGSKTIPFCTKPIHYTALLQNLLQSRGTIKS